MSFWARYVLLKERQGIARIETLDRIEAIKGFEFREEIETEIQQYES